MNQKKQYSEFPIKIYLRILQQNGIINKDSRLPKLFEILDENTLLKKQPNHKYSMKAFTKIFSPKICNMLISRQVNLVDDLCEGINHTSIIIGQSQARKFMLNGSLQHPGLAIEYFNRLHTDQKLLYSKRKSKIYFSMFSTVNKPNHFIDLLTGQRYVFLSKKDIEGYKTFYSKNILDLNDFLICLKIALTRFQECCNEDDSIIYRLVLQNQDDFTQKKTKSSAHLIFLNPLNKSYQFFIKNIENLLKNCKDKSTDHGSLFDYISSYAKNTKISIINSCFNNVQSLDKIHSNVQNITKIGCYVSRLKRNYVQKSCDEIAQQSKQKKYNFNSQFSSFSSKQMAQAKNIVNLYKVFLKDSKVKLETFVSLHTQIHKIRSQFYERQRFPVSLQVKGGSIKNYFISKIYSLSQKYQMEDIQQYCQKLKIIKNQLLISLKNLYKKTEGIQSQISPKFQYFLETYEQQLDYLKLKIKSILQIDETKLQNWSIKIQNYLNEDYLTSISTKLSLNNSSQIQVSPKKSRSVQASYIIRKVKASLEGEKGVIGDDLSFKIFKYEKQKINPNKSLLVGKKQPYKYKMLEDQSLIQQNKRQILVSIVQNSKHVCRNKEKGNKQNRQILKNSFHRKDMSLIMQKKSFLPEILVIKKQITDNKIQNHNLFKN